MGRSVPADRGEEGREREAVGQDGLESALRLKQTRLAKLVRAIPLRKAENDELCLRHCRFGARAADVVWRWPGAVPGLQ